MHPYGIEATLTQLRADTAVEGPQKTHILAVADIENYGKKFMCVSVEQRNIPFDLDAESAIDISANRKRRAKKDLKIDVRLLRNFAQQRGLVLNGMTCEVGETEFSIEGKGTRRGLFHDLHPQAPHIQWTLCGADFSLALAV